MSKRKLPDAAGKRRFFDNHAGGWDSGRRDDPLLAKLVADLPLHPGEFVVEPGCGTALVSGLILERIGAEGGLLAFDLSPKMIEQAQDKKLGPVAEFRVADAVEIPLEAATADAVVCVRVFPHFDNQSAALAEFNRVLKLSGLLIIAHLSGREKLNAYHTRAGGEVADDKLPDEAGMRVLLGSAGFEVDRIEDRDNRYLVIACKRREL